MTAATNEAIPTTGTASREAPATSGARYRRDIDGLRAIAILSVVAYHARIPGIAGGFVGVDVFFVLSGFLITSLLYAEAAAGGTISLAGFYARRIRRLFPAVFAMVCVTCVAGFYLLLPIFDQQQELARSALATALYVSNFYFWLNAPGYFDERSEFDPLLHTWSLSVEEQFYIVWPLVILAALWLVRRSGWDLRRTLLGLALTIFALSLVWCVWDTTIDTHAAFYLLPSRAWELATGAALALLLVKIPSDVSSRFGLACSAFGLTAIVSAVTMLSADLAFPGYLALLPVVGTALVVAGGHLASTNLVQRALSTRVPVFIGMLSYSWYLWHWPLLALVRAYRMELDVAVDTAVAALSLALAYVSYRFVENPVRFGRPGPFRRTPSTLVAGVLISIAMCVPALALGAWAKYVGSRRPEYQPLVAAQSDRPPLRAACHQTAPFLGLNPADHCTLGSGASPVLLVWGDSHADHLSPLMQSFVAAHPGVSIRLRSFSACAPLLKATVGWSAQARACAAFNQAVLSEVRQHREQGTLKGVVLAGRWLRLLGASPWNGGLGGTVDAAQANAQSLERTLSELEPLGVNVLLVAPFPEMRYESPPCLARHDAAWCGMPRSVSEMQRSRVVDTLSALARKHSGVRVFDAFDTVCDSAYCEATRPDVAVVYLDHDHLTATASRALLPAATPSLLWAAGR